jgi:NitT/TauT family transport system substrate-binding protein
VAAIDVSLTAWLAHCATCRSFAHQRRNSVGAASSYEQANGRVDFVRRNPIATRRVVRAMMRATDICAAKPAWVAQRLVDRGVTPRSDYARQGLEEVSYRAWRDYDTEDSVRFWALRLREIGWIKSSPDKILAHGTDWRFINEVRKELG